MTMWIPTLTGRRGHRYEALADAIAEAVRDGQLRPGVKLPPQRHLAWKLGLTVGTVSRAYSLAEQRRLVSGHVGRGTYVIDPANSQASPAAPGAIIDLTRNVPGIARQTVALSTTLAEISRWPFLHTLLEYQPEAGHRRYREAAATWVKRVGLEAPPERIVVTGGAQHALSLALLTLAKPGDTVLTEKLTYSGVPNAIRLGGAKPVGIGMDDEGALPDELDRAARETGARLAFLTPTLHSPTLGFMGEQRRRDIAAVARARDLILIEDDVYGYLTPDRPAPIAMLAPERTIYLTSVSKCLGPGLRVAWLVAPTAMHDRLASTLYAVSMGLPSLGFEVVARWIADGTADHLVKDLQADVADRHALVSEALRGVQWRGRPDALHAFITLPDTWRAPDFAAESHRAGVALCSAHMFAVDASEAPNGVRISISSTRDKSTLERALGVIGELLRREPGDSAEALRRRVV